MSVAIDYSSGAFKANKAQGVGTITGSTLDISTGNYFNYTPTANTTFAFSNAPASGTAAGFALAVTGANVGTGYDIANASYDSVSLSIASEETFPTDLAASSDGTKFYVLGAAGYSIDQYNLTTAWDLSTGSYANKTFSTQSQASAPNGLSFKSDGTKVYVADTVNDAIYQYALSTAWDISTASYENKSFDLNSNSPNIGNPYGIQFKSDGSKMYVIGHSTDAVYQYSLSTSWDVSTASYDSVTFATKPQDGGPHALFFAPTGTKFYVLGIVNDKVFEYSLTTAWDLSSSSYSGNSFSIGSQENDGRGLFFKDDGSKMYAVGWQNDTIYQYSTGSTSAATFSYPASVEWPSGTSPDAPASGETDVLVFYTDDGGTSYQGFQAGDAMA